MTRRWSGRSSARAARAQRYSSPSSTSSSGVGGERWPSRTYGPRSCAVCRRRPWSGWPASRRSSSGSACSSRRSPTPGRCGAPRPAPTPRRGAAARAWPPCGTAAGGPVADDQRDQNCRRPSHRRTSGPPWMRTPSGHIAASPDALRGCSRCIQCPPLGHYPQHQLHRADSTLIYMTHLDERAGKLA